MKKSVSGSYIKESGLGLVCQDSHYKNFFWDSYAKELASAYLHKESHYKIIF